MDPREAASNKFAKVKAGSYPETSSAEEPTSGYVGHVVQRLPGSAPFHVGNMPLSNVGDPAMYSGQMISPTHPQGPLQYMHHHVSTSVHQSVQCGSASGLCHWYACCCA